jgi:excisionase family DNA binding protein
MGIIDEETLTRVVRLAVKEELDARDGSLNVIGSLVIGERADTQVRPNHDRPNHDTLHSMKELADFLGCCVQTAQKMKNDGRIPYRQIGRKVLFDKDEVLKAMEKKRH